MHGVTPLGAILCHKQLFQLLSFSGCHGHQELQRLHPLVLSLYSSLSEVPMDIRVPALTSCSVDVLQRLPLDPGIVTLMHE